MTLVDLLIIAAIIAAMVHGATQGAAVQVLSYVGLAAGMAGGAALGPWAANHVIQPFGRAFTSLLVLFGLAAIGGALGRAIGVRVWNALQRMQLGAADATAGSIVSAIAAVLIVWIVLVVLAAGPSRPIAASIQQSGIARFIRGRMPPPPTLFSRIRSFVDATGFPQVFAGIEPRPLDPVTLPSDPIVQAAVAKARASTVRVQGTGCGGIESGSGFVAGPGLVVTNAHVVAGVDRPFVEDRRGRHPATIVLFDPELDIAVLRTTGLAGPVLRMLRVEVPRGDQGAILGFPGGGAFDARPGAVRGEFRAVGRDIYGQRPTTRRIYQLDGRVIPGNSGGPFVRPNGDVVGVIFASSTTDANVGYAITSGQVVPLVERATEATARVDSGPCAA